MKLAIILILVGLFQIGAGGFYGLLAPIRTEENVQSDLNRARSAAEERIKEELSPEFVEKWPVELDLDVAIQTKEAESLARSAREGWNHLHTCSWILAVAGVITLVSGITKMKSEPVGSGQPM